MLQIRPETPAHRVGMVPQRRSETWMESNCKHRDGEFGRAGLARPRPPPPLIGRCAVKLVGALLSVNGATGSVR